MAARTFQHGEYIAFNVWFTVPGGAPAGQADIQDLTPTAVLAQAQPSADTPLADGTTHAFTVSPSTRDDGAPGFLCELDEADPPPVGFYVAGLTYRVGGKPFKEPLGRVRIEPAS